jgi:hypothetical protein
MPAPERPATQPSTCFPLAGLADAVRELERRGRSVRWDLSDCCGVTDVRLLVDTGGPAVSVEVLVPGPADCWWDAVRVKPASRLVWRGPQRECPGDQLTRFVEDLLTQDVEQLPGRYQLLG